MYTENCELCIINNQKYKRKPRAPLRQYKVALPNEVLHIDIVGSLNNQRTSYQWILVIVDKMSRYCKAAAMRTAESKEIARCLAEKWLFKLGLPYH